MGLGGVVVVVVVVVVLVFFMTSTLERPSLGCKDTEYNACSVEFCHEDAYSDVLACGMYQLTEGTETSSTIAGQHRVGRLLLYRLHQTPQGYQLDELYREESSGILDLKWLRKSVNGRSILGKATSEGYMTLCELLENDGQLELNKLNTVSTTNNSVLCLSIDELYDETSGICKVLGSYSDGTLAVSTLREDASTTIVSCWKAHDFESWNVHGDAFLPNYLYSGGDDSLFRMWDVRDVTRPVFTNKSHQAGVCSIRSHHLNEHIVATGSYDELIRVWDKRQWIQPLLEINAGGGVWRLKWHPTQAFRLVAACMYGGIRAFNVDAVHEFTPSYQISSEFLLHTSMAYGVDWCHACKKNELTEVNLVASCSFYDHILHVWQAQ